MQRGAGTAPARGGAATRRERDAGPARSTSLAQDGPAVRACTYRPPCPASFGGSVVADRTFRRRPDASLHRSLSPRADQLARDALGQPRVAGDQAFGVELEVGGEVAVERGEANDSGAKVLVALW